MARSYDTTLGLPYPRVGRILIDYPESGAPTVEYIERTAIVDAAGDVRLLDGVGTTHRMQIPALTQPVQLVDPATGALMGGTTTVRDLLLGITALLRRDQLLRDGVANPLVPPPAPPSGA